MANLTKEERYRKDNPDATPYDLLSAGAIDQARYNDLISHEQKSAIAVKPQESEDLNIKPAASDKLIPNKVIQHRAAPKLSQQNTPKSGNVYLYDKTLNKTTWMSRGAAEREVRKYPHRYSIS